MTCTVMFNSSILILRTHGAGVVQEVTYTNSSGSFDPICTEFFVLGLVYDGNVCLHNTWTQTLNKAVQCFSRISLTTITTSDLRSRYVLSCRRAHDYETTVKASEHSTR